MAIARIYRILPALAVLAGVLSIWPAPALGADPEGCLMCHRYRGLARREPETNALRLFYVAPDYYDRALGPHARLKCTDCHNKANVEVIPHRKQLPLYVDCTRTCHLSSSSRMARDFDHGPIDQTLKSSIHSTKALDRSNELLGRPLVDGQSHCLLCHDEPVFRLTGQNWAQNEAPVQRCGACHRDPGSLDDGRLEVDTRVSYWHVESRVGRGKASSDVVATCALCHANARIRAEFSLPNSVASYLTSFHGKAMELGDQGTANCLDCHVGQFRKSHDIRARKDAGSPINPANASDTCRSPQCHPRAGRAVSSAAVHMELATGGGIEYFIAFAFIIMIATTFGPSLMLTALEMLQIVVGRHDPSHHDHLHKVRRLMADPRGPAAIRRFTPLQRAQHWTLAITFATLCITGFPMKFADQAWASWVVATMGGLGVTRTVHRIAAVLLMAGFAFHFGYVGRYLLRQVRLERAAMLSKRTPAAEPNKDGGPATRPGRLAKLLSLPSRAFRQVRDFVIVMVRALFALPMMMSPRDLKHMGQLIAYLLFLRKTRPETGRFSPEEKFEYFGVFWGTCLLGLTGVLMWANAWTTRFLPGRTLTLAYLIHTFEAFLALLHVGVVHMVAVVFSPGVFPCSPAMFTGNTPAEEMVERHSAMITQAARELSLPAGLGDSDERGDSQPPALGAEGG